MVADVESLSQIPLNLFQPWKKDCAGPVDNDHSTSLSLLHSFESSQSFVWTPQIKEASIAHSTPRRLPAHATGSPVTLDSTSDADSTASWDPTSSEGCLSNSLTTTPHQGSGPDRSFSFRPRTTPWKNITFELATRDSYRDAVKRRRPDADVDGPNTAGLSCKKRRLRLQLITSRLSQPYSLPAPHILTRERGILGDKRCLKVASQVDMIKRVASYQSASSEFRRAAVLNRMRLQGVGAQQGRPLTTVRSMFQLDTGVQPASLPVVNSLFLSLSLRLRGEPGIRCVAVATTSGMSRTLHQPSRRPQSSHIAMSMERSSLPKPRSPKPTPPTSPTLVPMDRSGGSTLVHEDDIDDDAVAFPTSEHESRYESSDDPDDVYSDFGAIFGQGEGESDEETNPYDTYLDEVDGISPLSW